MAAKVTDLLRKMEIFEQLPETELRKIGKLLKERKLAANQVVFRQGDQADSLYIVTQGRVKIAAADRGGREKVLAFCGEGQFFGEMALLSGAPRSATAAASTAVRLLQLRKDDFDRFVATNVEVMREMLRVVARRREATTRRLVEEVRAGAGGARGLLSVVFAPRGGAGRTTIATNLAVALAQRTPDRVVLVDLDLLFGHAALLLNFAPRTSLASLSAGALRQMDRESFNYYLTTHADSSLRVLVGALRPEEGELVTGDHVRAVIELLRRQFVHVVVDAARGFAEPTLAAIELADEVLMVCTPDTAAVRAMQECQRIFGGLFGLPRERFTYALNHPSPYKALSAEQVEQALGVRLVSQIPFGGNVPARAALEGQPLVAKWPANAASKAIAGLASVLERAASEAVALAAS